MVLVHGWGWDVKGAAPDLHLLLAVFFSCLGLVEASEASVVTLIQTPRTDHRQPHLVSAFHDGPQRLDRTLQYRGVAHVKLEAGILDSLGSTLGLPHTLLTEVGIEPATEAVLLVPGALAVTDDNQTMGSSHVYSVSSEPDSEPSALLSCVLTHTLADQQ